MNICLISNKQTPRDEKGQPPAVKYWEDHYCEECEQITEFKRNFNWDMCCSECGRKGYEDPLKPFYDKNYVSLLELRRLSRKFYKQSREFAEAFLNFEGGNETKYIESRGKDKHWMFKRFSGGIFTKTEENSDHNLNLKRAVQNYKDYHIKIWMWEDCQQGQSAEYLEYWENQIKIKENVERELYTELGNMFEYQVIESIHWTTQGLEFKYKFPKIRTNYTIKQLIFEWDPLNLE